ncbi:thioesterase family protein [Micromonosporaceae bacterium DT55]|uniref:thioesterase family protein n=1 Tax=Melissospora conviva TaxID=3388432 RepID=UPI003C297484
MTRSAVPGSVPAAESPAPAGARAESPGSAFDTATGVSRDGDGVWRADLAPDWDLGTGILNGGYLLSVVGRAAVLDSPHEHPVALAAGFLRPARADRATLHVSTAPPGRTTAHATVGLADSTGTLISAQVTTATLTAVEAAGSRPDATPVEKCLPLTEEGARSMPGVPFPGLMRQVETRLDPVTAGWVFGKPADEPVHRAWVRFADGRDPDPLALVLFADVLPPTGFALGRMGWAPTVQIQVLVRDLPAPGWCLVETRGGEVRDGWVDEDCRIWDSTGRLVAQARQLARVARAPQ